MNWQLLQVTNMDTANLLQHHSMPLGKLLGVTLRGIRKARNRTLAEEEAKHAADVATADLQMPTRVCATESCRLRARDHTSGLSMCDQVLRTLRCSIQQTVFLPPAWCPCSRAASRIPGLQMSPRKHVTFTLSSLGTSKILQATVDELAGELV